MVNVLDLFCGAGGLSLGFEMEGFEIKAGIDIENSFLKTYKKSHPNTYAIKEDLSKADIITTLKDSNIKESEIDFVIGGPPCQGFSTAGNRMVDDPRNKLVKMYVKTIKDIKPTMFLMENVSGLASMKNGVGELVSEEILKLFNEYGYKTYFKILLAADYGVPQLRKRIFFVGIKKDLDLKFKWPQKRFYPKASLMSYSDSETYLTVKDAISDLPSLKVGEEASVYDYPPKNKYQNWIRNGSGKLLNHKAPKHSELVIERIKNIPQGGNHSNLPEDLKLKSGYPNIYGRLKYNSPADTITANCGCASAPGRFIHPKDDRVITVREGARLQSFPDTIEFFGSSSNQYKQVGNAVPPLLARALAESFKELYKMV